MGGEFTFDGLGKFRIAFRLIFHGQVNEKNRAVKEKSIVIETFGRPFFCIFLYFVLFTFSDRRVFLVKVGVRPGKTGVVVTMEQVQGWILPEMGMDTSFTSIYFQFAAEPTQNFDNDTLPQVTSPFKDDGGYPACSYKGESGCACPDCLLDLLKAAFSMSDGFDASYGEKHAIQSHYSDLSLARGQVVVGLWLR